MAAGNTPTSLDAILSGQKIHSRIRQSGHSISEIQEMLGLECPQSIYRWLKGQSMPSCRDGDFDTMSIKISVPAFCSYRLKTVDFCTFLE